VELAKVARTAYFLRDESVALTKTTQEICMSDGVNRFLGDTPARILIKLVLISLVVGVVMSAFHWTPYDIFYGIRDFFLRLWNMGFSAIAGFVDYFILGAAVVIPAFILLRILSYRK
jgi:hypothetical protein